jgi:hypothetical protein
MWNDGSSGKFNGSLGFDGTDDIVNISDNDELDLTEQFTFAAWVYRTSNNGEMVLMQKGTTDDCQNYGIVIDASNQVTPLSSNSCSWGNAGSQSIIPQNTWTHVAVSFDGTNARTYINGLLTDTVAFSMGDVNSGDLVIGGRTGAPSSDWFTGNLDDVRLYNYAVPQSKIIQIMNQNSVQRFD